MSEMANSILIRWNIELIFPPVGTCFLKRQQTVSPHPENCEEQEISQPSESPQKWWYHMFPPFGIDSRNHRFTKIQISFVGYLGLNNSQFIWSNRVVGRFVWRMDQNLFNKDRKPAPSTFLNQSESRADPHVPESVPWTVQSHRCGLPHKRLAK